MTETERAKTAHEQMSRVGKNIIKIPLNPTYLTQLL